MARTLEERREAERLAAQRWRERHPEAARESGRLATQRRRRRYPEYRSWESMIKRCENPNLTNFSEYGGRGITICAEWRESFQRFLADVGPRPANSPGWRFTKPEYSIDRIDVDGPYSKENVRWATAKEQRANRRPPRRKADMLVETGA